MSREMKHSGIEWIVNPPEEWKDPTARPEWTLAQTRITPTSTPTSTEQVPNPAIAEGYVRLLYPQSPRHPRQKYLLTVKGLALLNEKEEEV